MTTPPPFPPSADAPMRQGALARALVDAEDGSVRAGQEFEIEEYLPDCAEGPAAYYGNRMGGYNNVFIAADRVEQVKSAEEMAARRVPTCEEVARHLDLLGDHEVFDADETEPDGATVTVYGATPDGLRVAVEVRVIGVTQVDW